jgi:hypothetical protein
VLSVRAVADEAQKIVTMVVVTLLLTPLNRLPRRTPEKV